MAVDTRRVTRKRVPQDPRKRTVQYAEEAGGTRLRVAQRSRRGQICRRSRLGVRDAG